LLAQCKVLVHDLLFRPIHRSFLLRYAQLLDGAAAAAEEEEEEGLRSRLVLFQLIMMIAYDG